MSKAPFKAYYYSKNGERKVKVQNTSRYKYTAVENGDSYKSDSHKGIYITADGLGGYEGAKIASQHSTILAYNDLIGLSNLMKKRHLNDEMIYSFLNDSFRKTNECIKAWSDIPHLKGCSTTMDAILISEDKIYGAHVGDGSVFKINTRTNTIDLITKTNKGIENTDGLSDLEYDIVNCGIVSNPIGRENIDIQLYSVDMQHQDIILMATDGLTKKVHPEEIVSAFSGKDFIGGVRALKIYCRKPDKMRDFVKKLGTSYDIDEDKLFHDDTTFIAIRRND